MHATQVNLKVREHKILGPYVEGLRSFATKDFNAMNALILEGIKSRVTATTAMNDQSSRSHAVFNITLTESTFDTMSGNTGEKTSRISLVDLAGSERVWRTGADGERLREGGSINKSLSTLGLVISNLADIATGKKVKDSFIPYRDSVLTWLLKENLGGNSKTVMIATISPSEDSYEESLSTLRYANTAKRIQTYAVVNEDANAKMIRDLREEVEHLRHMLAAGGMQGTATISDSQMLELREKLAESERLMKEMSMSWEERLRIAHQVLEERAKQLKDMGISVQGGGISVDADKRCVWGWWGMNEHCLFTCTCACCISHRVLTVAFFAFIVRHCPQSHTCTQVSFEPSTHDRRTDHVLPEGNGIPNRLKAWAGHSSVV